jgi:hypothetical protein
MVGLWAWLLLGSGSVVLKVGFGGFWAAVLFDK